MRNPILKVLASLKLTVVLMGLAIVLVFAGTCAQVDMSIWQVQKRFFHSVFLWLPLQDLVPRFSSAPRTVPGAIPFPGGYTLGVLMLMNLLAAHLTRFRFSWKDLALLPALGVSILVSRVIPPEGVWPLVACAVLASVPLVAVVAPLHGKRAGIILIHLGLILLIVGEGLSSVMMREGRMVLDPGVPVSYSENARQVELAVIDPSPTGHDNVAVVRQSRLSKGAEFRDGRMPFEIRVDDLYANAAVLGPFQAQRLGLQANSKATAGAGVGLTVLEQPSFSGTEASRSDLPAGYVTLSDRGRPLATYLVSPGLPAQDVTTADGKTYRIQLRYRREYYPFTLTLLKFSHDRYTGTEIARNFSSRVQLVDPARQEDREVTIRMNSPLRHAGMTFFQASFLPGDQTSILQVVRNPAWLLPYISCMIGGLGLLLHFCLRLGDFLLARAGVRRRDQIAAEPAMAPSGSLWGAIVVPAGSAVALMGIVLAYTQRVPKAPGEFDLSSFARLPVSFEGRVQPLDSLARNTLRILSGRQVVRGDEGSLPAIQWLLDVLSNPPKAEQHKVVRIDHPDVVSLLNLDPKRHYFSIEELRATGQKLEEQVFRAERVEPKSRDGYQRQMVDLGNRLRRYMAVAEFEQLHLAPPLTPGQEWQTVAQAVQESQQTRRINEGVQRFATLLQAYVHNQPGTFNQQAEEYHGSLHTTLPAVMAKVDFEVLFNRIDPFYACMLLYVVVFVLAVCSWLGWTRPLSRMALALLIATLVLHSLGLVGRMYISGRPPVTNLASSAIFIAWGAVVLAAVLEGIFRNGVGSVVGSVVGGVSLLIYYNLSLVDGDTMKVLVAVLDTNIWLATHVVTITLGYSATFLAGILGIVYVLRGVFGRGQPSTGADNRLLLGALATASAVSPATAAAMALGTAAFVQLKTLSRMIYGTLCFALLFSFVGTVLGGIWADQSWGRFWGWDPKENGAVLIVLWIALVLHARWAGLARERGLAVLAIGGNIVTAWSWFGTNMLGVGLHSYGFMDAAIQALLLSIFSQLALITVGMLPLRYWRSYAGQREQELAPAA